MRSFLFVFISLFIGFQVHAQQLHSRSKKAIGFYKEAKRLDSLGNWFQSIDFIKQALAKDRSFDEAYLLLAQSYLKRNDPRSAYQVLIESQKETEEYIQHQMLLELAVFHHSQGQYDQAHAFRKQLKDSIPGTDQELFELVISNIDFAYESVQNPQKVESQELPNPLNIFEAQYFPSLTADGKLIFTGRDRRDRGDEDIYITEFQNGRWRDVVPISDKINTDLNEGTASISADGRNLVFTGCNRSEGVGSCDLYFSRLGENGWSNPENLGEGINTIYWESQPSLSQDGRVLYFVSNRPDGFGGQDVWVSYWSGSSWSPAENLGDVINTSLDDCSPYIYPDGKTLYYASRGKVGLGGLDLFRTVRTDDSWEEPVNLGFPINTFQNQVGYTLGLDGWAYYSDNNFLGQTKLYRFKMPEALLPKTKVELITGIIRDSLSKEPLNAELLLADLSRDSTALITTSDAGTGTFQIAPELLPKQALYVQAPGYLMRIISARDLRPEKAEIIELVPLRVGSKIILNNIQFEFNSSALNEAALKELELASKFLLNNPSVHVEIGGHTDRQGEDDYNLSLSNDRAKTVFEFFLKKNVPEENLEYRGYGEKLPIFNSEGVYSADASRRIEIVITKK